MFAFVLMPFDQAFDDIYKLGIKETCEKLGVSAERVDEQIFHQENILERIYSQIEIADFIIADMTGRNPNVFYEVGYAQGKGKKCLLLTSNADDIPFDLKHHRHIVYGSSIQGLRQALEKDLVSVKSEIENRRSIITVNMNRAQAELKKTKYFATGLVELCFDLNNKTNTPSPEIEAIYFHTGDGWTFKQDDQLCASTQTLDGNFTAQHFVKSPVRRISSGGWAQITLKGEKELDDAFDGRQMKDSYRIFGRALFSLVTSQGAFNYPFDIDLEADEIPF